jgi:hypothetical protein
LGQTIQSMFLRRAAPFQPPRHIRLGNPWRAGYLLPQDRSTDGGSNKWNLRRVIPASLSLSLSLPLSLSPFLLSHGGRICLSGARASLGKHASGKSPTSSTVSHLQPVFPSREHPYGVHHPRLGTPTPFPASSTPRSPRWTPYWPWARHDGHPASPIALLPRIHLVDALKT